ncbi:discoidin domain-containing protein [Arthrobacter dokdonensis]|uniref:discoidin domain-containing protein n=1 Tax=Arthrobacter dokdonellae TaxID=2211210 RepID=UPI001013D202|nr:discoidin domain-containing protein [Arthrobacter dokdonellae]
MDDPGRSIRNFNTDWKFVRGDISDGHLASFDDAAWDWVNLPHGINFNTSENVAEYLGVAWYRKSFATEPCMGGKKVFLEFGAAMQKAEVWLNGTKLAVHVGGYTPFTVDVTGQLVARGENVVAVRIDTRPNPAWGPGRTGVDFRYFGGIYRDVTMTLTDPVHITDAVHKNDVASGGLFITTPTVAPAKSVVQVRTDVLNDSSAVRAITVHSDVLDASGAVVATAAADAAVSLAAGTSAVVQLRLTVHNANLWHPNTPHLYQARVRVLADGVLVDARTERFGIRHIDWRHEGLFINGSRFKAIGTNKHQEIYGLGNAVPSSAIFLDVKRVKDCGFDFIRTSHYPNAPAFYAACDELGVLVLNSMTGWQTFNNTDSFKGNTYQELRDIIRRDRNHPSVVAWETSLNESSYSAEWANEVHRIAHEEYPGDQMFTAGWLDYFDIFLGASQHGIRDTNQAKPILISEWGDWDYGGNRSTSRVARESYDWVSMAHNNLSQADNHQEGLNANLGAAWFSADGLWAFADMSGYNPGASLMGVVDYCRIRKYSSYLFQSQRDADIAIPGVDSGAMVFIANTWSADSPVDVRVYSNAEQVRLFKNGGLIGEQFPDSGANTANLPHPPFTFNATPYSPGELRAEALIGGEVVATHRIRTAGAAVRIALNRESGEAIAADGSDARLVFIEVQDADGTMVHANASQVSLSVTGPGRIVGPATVTMKGGQLAVWVRAGRAAGQITLTASADGLLSGTTSITATEVPGLPAPRYDDQNLTASNIAIGAVASASSSLPCRPPANAVDQDAATSWVAGSEAAEAGDAPAEKAVGGGSWLQVDLMKRHDLQGSVLTWNWQPGWPYTIQVSEDGIVWDAVAEKSVSAFGADVRRATATASDSWLASGRFVRVAFPDTFRAAVPEVTDFALRGTQCSPPPPVDVAQEKTAVRASSFAPEHGAEVANNGNPAEYWQAGSGGPAWWAVDLGARYRLSSVLVTWVDGSRAYQYLVEVSKDGSSYVTAVDQGANATPGTESQDAFEATARYVRLSVVGGSTSESPVGAYNVKTLGVPAPNVVVRKTSKASSARAGHGPAMANDMLPDTSWQSAPGTGADQWWSADLGAGFTLDGVDVDLVSGSVTDYRLETSLDGQVWTLAGGSRGPAGMILTEPVATRYVRITFHLAGPDEFAGIRSVVGYASELP